MPVAAHAAEDSDRAAARSQLFQFDIPAAPLAKSIDAFVEVTGWQIAYSAELARGLRSTPVSGELTAGAALAQLLAGTGLIYEFDGGNTAILRPVAERSPQAGTQSGTLTLPPVQVSAALEAEGKGYDQPGSTTAIGRRDMDRAAPRHASEILQAAPGVASITNEQNPAVAVQVRGLKDFGRVNMNIDGMRQNFQRSGHQQRNGEMYFDTELLSRVDISKGPTSEAGGAGATGGVASFHTLETGDLLAPGEKAGGRLRTSSGAGRWDNGLKPSASLALAARPGGDTDILLAYSHKKSDAYEPGQNGQALRQPAGYDIPARIVNGTGQDMQSLLLKSGWSFAEGQRLQFTLIDTRAEYSESASQNGDQAYNAWTCGQPFHAEQDYCRDFEYNPEDVYPVTSTNILQNRNYALDYQLLGENPLLDLSLKAYYVDTKNDYRSIDEDIRSLTRTETLGGLASNRAWISLGDDLALELTMGLEGFEDQTVPDTESTTLSGDEIASANGVTPEGNRRLLSAFASAKLLYGGWLEITPGLRYDTYRLWGTANYQTPGRVQFLQVNVDREQDKWLPTLGLAVSPLEPLQIFANAGLGWRPPAITETLISGAVPGHAVATNSYPNWTLEAEETRSFEFGFNLNLDSLFGDGDRFNLKLVHFDSETENYIYLANTIGTPGASRPTLGATMYANALQPIRFVGEELSLDYQRGIWYGALQVTRMERKGRLTTYYYPAGGAPDDEHWQTTTLDDSSLYYPIPPEYTAALNLGARPLSGALDIGLQLRHTDESGSHWGTDLDAAEVIESSLVLDLYGDWEISDAFRVGLRLKNVTDRQYIKAQGDAVVKTYAPGRTFSASLAWVF